MIRQQLALVDGLARTVGRVASGWSKGRRRDCYSRQRCGSIGSQEVATDEGVWRPLVAANHLVVRNRVGGFGEVVAPDAHRCASRGQKQSRQEVGVWLEVAHQSNHRRLCVWRSGVAQPLGGRHAAVVFEEISRDLWSSGDAGNGGLRPWRQRWREREEVGKSRGQEDRHPTQRQERMVGCRGRPKSRVESSGQDRRSDRQPQSEALRFQQRATTQQPKPDGSRTSSHPWIKLQQADSRLDGKLKPYSQSSQARAKMRGKKCE